MTRIKHPTISGSVYIAEVVITRLDRQAVNRCGLHDTLYEQFFSQEVMEFAIDLLPEERDKFLTVVSDLHSGFDAHSYLLIAETIKKINGTYNL